MPKPPRQARRGGAPRQLLLGVTGSIGAYKAADLIELFKTRGFRVTVVMTKEAQAFITPLTLQALSGEPVYTELLHDHTPSGIVHIELADHADVVVIAPATANILGKLAQGLADDLLTCLVLATRAPVVIAPAMNVKMYEHPAVQQNVERLRAIGYHIVEPVWGKLACGYEGVGHLADLEVIVTAVHDVCVKRIS